MTTAMRAVTTKGEGHGIQVTDRPLPVLREPTDVLVEVIATGVCGTDRAIALGEFPAVPGVVLGHETVGRVAEVGSAGAGLAIGQRVVINPTYYCNNCRACRQDRRAFCPAKAGRELGIDCDGSMADFIVLPQRFVHPVPEEVSDRRAVMVEPLACVLNNLRAAAPGPAAHTVILGGGPIGALCALVLAHRGAQVTLIEPDPHRASTTSVILPPTVAVTQSWPDRDRPDVVIDTVGTLPLADLELVADGATLVIMGERREAVTTLALRTLATRAIRVLGAGPYAPGDFEMALDLARVLPLESLITHVLPLNSAARAFAKLGVPAGRQGYGALKVVLTPGTGELR